DVSERFHLNQREKPTPASNGIVPGGVCRRHHVSCRRIVFRAQLVGAGALLDSDWARRFPGEGGVPGVRRRMRARARITIDLGSANSSTPGRAPPHHGDEPRVTWPTWPMSLEAIGDLNS